MMVSKVFDVFSWRLATYFVMGPLHQAKAKLPGGADPLLGHCILRGEF
jgi:hypothetical protein